VIITEVEFSECREASSAHPVLKMLIVVELRDVGGIISIWEPEGPVRWGNYFREVLVSGCVDVFFGFTGPCNPLISEVVRAVLRRADQHRLLECVIE